MKSSSESRRLQKIKGGSFTLSIPKWWAEKRQLRGGDSIIVSEEDGSLRLYPEAKPPSKARAVMLQLEDFPDIRSLEYSLRTYYMQGAERISVASRGAITSEVKKRLRALRLEMTGLDIVEESAKHITFEVLIDPSRLPLETLIRSTSEFALRLLHDAVQAVLGEDRKLAEEVVERGADGLRQYRVIIRQISAATLNRSLAAALGIRDCRESVTFGLLARDLQRSIRHATSIATQLLGAKRIGTLRSPIRSLVSELAATAEEMQRGAVKAFLERDPDLTFRVIARMSTVRDKERRLLTAIHHSVRDIDVALALGMVARDLRRIAGYAVAIADDAANRILTPA